MSRADVTDAAAFHTEGAHESRRAALFAWEKPLLGEAARRLAAKPVYEALRQRP